ncbi:TadE family type IV pilus minor pilin [Embleya hyalina]|uniref:TadE family type IV pilus minor pilin n=1 Tax=Embleya hyalina TaxID=516124 RepID=UPI0014775FDB|nr:TadE family type IV pilus minor pilin [Embleya hyalina]
MTAETAVVLPVLVVLTAVLTAGIGAAAAQIRCVDAAQAGARALARGEPTEVAVARASAAGPVGARTGVSGGDGLVRFRVSAEVGVPGAAWAGVTFHVEHTAVAAVEAEAPP